MLGLIVSAGATAAELILGTVATVTTGKIAYDGLKNDKSESFHAAKIDEIHEKKNKEREAKAEAKAKAEEEAAQNVAISLIKNSKAFAGAAKILESLRS